MVKMIPEKYVGLGSIFLVILGLGGMVYAVSQSPEVKESMLSYQCIEKVNVPKYLSKPVMEIDGKIIYGEPELVGEIEYCINGRYQVIR